MRPPGIRPEVSRGAFIYQQGEISHQFYQLISGRIRIFNGHQDGRQNILAIVEPGGLFGEAACFDEVPYYTTAVTELPSRIRVFPRKATLRAMRAEPDIMIEILRSITRKQRLLAILIETVMFRKAPARVALILSRLATYYGEPVTSGRGVRIRLHLSHEILASMIGVSRVTVTRQIGALVRSGIIDCDKRHLIVLHPHRLYELAQLP